MDPIPAEILDIDRFQRKLTTLVAVFEIPMCNFGVWMIYNVSDKQTKLSRSLQIAHLVTLFVSQFFAGTVFNIVFLYPVPVIYCIGWIQNFDHALMAMVVFIFMFTTQFVFLAFLHIVRFRLIVGNTRKKAQNVVFSLITIFIIFYVYIGHLTLWAFQGQTRQRQRDYIQQNYPTYKYIFQYQCVVVLMDLSLHILTSCVMSSIFVVFVIFYFTTYFIMLTAIKNKSASTSIRNSKNQITLVTELVIQSTVVGLFLVSAPAFILYRIFLNNDEDFMMLRIVFILFISAPNISIISLAFRNNYRRFLFNSFCKTFPSHQSLKIIPSVRLNSSRNI